MIRKVTNSGATSFATIQTPAGTSPVADSSADILSLTSTDSTVIITGNSTTDTINFSISGTSPEFLRLKINSSSNTYSLNTAATLDIVQIEAEDSDGVFNSITCLSHSSTGETFAFTAYGASRGTKASPTDIQSGDAIGGLAFLGYNTSTYFQAAYIVSIVQNTPSFTSMPAWLYFATTPNGSIIPAPAMVITEDQNTFIYGDFYPTLAVDNAVPYIAITKKLSTTANFTYNSALDRLECGDLRLNGITPARIISTSATSILQEEAFSANGQLIIGKSSGGFSKNTITAGSNIVVTNGSGTISLATSLTPTFTSISAASITDSGLTANRVVFTGTGGLLSVSNNFQYSTVTSSLDLKSGYLTIGFVNWKVADSFTMVCDGNMGVIRPAGTSIGFKYYRGTSIVSTNLRWQLFVDAVSESGSNAGSNYRFNAYSDAGAFIDSPVQITRASGGVIYLIRPISITGTAFASSTITSGDTIYIGSSQTGSGNYMLRMNRYTGTEAQTSGFANKISLYSSGAGNDAIIGFGVNGTSLDYVSNNAHTFYTNAVKCFVFATGVSDPIATFYAQSTVDFSMSSGSGLYSKIVSTGTTGTTNAISAEIRPQNSGSSSARYTGCEATPILTGVAGDITNYVTGFFSQSTLPPNTYTLTNYYGAWFRLARNVAGGTVTTKIGVYIDQTTNTAGTITTAYGLKIDALTLGSTNWQMAIGAGNSYFSGSTRFGSTTAPTSTVDITGTLTVSSTSTFSGLTASQVVVTNASKQLTSQALTNGQLLIGNTATSSYTAATITGTSNQITVTNGGGSITLSTPQNIDTAANVNFATVSTTGNHYVGSETGSASSYMLRMNRYFGTEAATSGFANKISLFNSGGSNDPTYGFGISSGSLDLVSSSQFKFWSGTTNVVSIGATSFTMAAGGMSVTQTRSGTGNAHTFVDNNSTTSGSATNLRVATAPANTGSSSATYAGIVASPTMANIGANITGQVTSFFSTIDLPPNTFTVTNVKCASFNLQRTVTGGTVTTMIGLEVGQGTASAGTVTTAYGIKVDSITLGGTNWSVYVAGGNSAFGGSTSFGAVTAPGKTVDITGTLGVSSTVTLTAKIGTYNNVATVANGIASIVATSDLTAQGAAIGATTIYAVPAAGAGMYRITWMATITRAATTTATLGGSTGFQAQFTDVNDSVVKLQNPTSQNNFTTSSNATGSTVSGVVVGYCKASTNLQYQFGYTSSGATSMQYDLSMRVEFLG